MTTKRKYNALLKYYFLQRWCKMSARPEYVLIKKNAFRLKSRVIDFNLNAIKKTCISFAHILFSDMIHHKIKSFTLRSKKENYSGDLC